MYEIIESADKVILNGIYSNNGDGGTHDAPYEINNEFAIKIKDANKDILVGDYDARYIDSHLSNCSLEIKHRHEVYELQWIKNKKIVFTGIGIRAGNHLAVSYIML